MGTALLCCSALEWMWIIDIFTAVLISSEFIFFFLPSFSIFSLTGSKVLCPWLCLILNRFMRTFVSYFLFSRIVKTDCQRATDWVESPHRLSSHCQAPHIHLWWGFNKANWPVTLLSKLLRHFKMRSDVWKWWTDYISNDYSFNFQYYKHELIKKYLVQYKQCFRVNG